ncbi:hypothetical protein JOM56_014896, partial [Amanita muscaria]
RGQTIPNVIVDIANPPTGTLSLFNLYVALSRSSGRESIRLLRDFDDSVFKKRHDPELSGEDVRLQSLDQLNVEWVDEMFAQGEDGIRDSNEGEREAGTGDKEMVV